MLEDEKLSMSNLLLTTFRSLIREAPDDKKIDFVIEAMMELRATKRLVPMIIFRHPIEYSCGSFAALVGEILSELDSMRFPLYDGPSNSLDQHRHDPYLHQIVRTIGPLAEYPDNTIQLVTIQLGIG